MAYTTRAFALAALFLLSIVPAACAERTASEERGKAIYFGEKGSALDTAEVQIGELTTKLPARTFPCASCHGRTGSGQSERGVTPSQITRDALTRPYTVKATAGRTRPPYTASSFRNAVRNGKDSGGNALAEAMPRFNFTDKQLADLWAFLDVIDDVTDPGLTDDTILIGVVLDAANPATSAQQKLLNTLASDINRIGGVNGRKLSFAQVSGKAAVADTVFGLIAPQGAAPTGLPSDVPVISVLPPSSPSAGTFALVTSEADQVAALKRFAVETWSVVSVKDACSAAKGDTVLLASAKCAGAAQNAQRVLMTQSVFASIAPPLRAKLPPESFVSIATPLGRIAPNAQAAFAKTRARAGNDKSAILAEADAYSTAALLIEALMRTGRDISRAGLIESLENVRNFEGGMTPALSFGPNRHVGSRGADIVRYDAKTASLASGGTWIEPGER